MVFVGVVYVFVYLCQYEEIKEAKEELMKVMELAKPEKPIVLILDSLDQLNPEDGAKQLNWLVIKYLLMSKSLYQHFQRRNTSVCPI